MIKQPESERLFIRASKVIPGGIYGHVSPNSGLPNYFPNYCKKAHGYIFEDVDGKEWIDFMCGYGAILHGYRNPEIESSVKEQLEYGSVFNQPSENMVELAEKLTNQIEFADWAVFAKNGSDLTTWAIRVARERTKRPMVIKAKGAYHGVDAWCDPGIGGRIASDRNEILEFEWNDLCMLQDIIIKNDNKIACIILTPYHHPSFAPSELPADDFWSTVRNLCDEHDIALILDDVRCGGRLSGGGSHCYFDFTPDLSVYSKALGNGYAISACVGNEKFKDSSMEVFLTGSCWNDAVAMKAALMSLEISSRDSVPENVLHKGSYFCQKLEEVSLKNNLPLRMTGPQSMPYPWIEGDENLFMIQKFSKFCALEGLFFHPHHNWFISNAHTNESLDHSLDKAESAIRNMMKGSD